VGFFAAARVDASAVELPAFAKLVSLLQRHSGLGYRLPSSPTLRARLPEMATAAQADVFAATYTGAGVRVTST